ncbi:hypothetical protein, partial [Salinibacter ruber]|uniref:hypothetical protein n=1 Tax=Salinibacter ruber TaxID=146919 RepID=UPI002169F706
KADERVPEPTGSYLPDKSGSFTALSRSLNTITQPTPVGRAGNEVTEYFQSDRGALSEAK